MKILSIFLAVIAATAWVAAPGLASPGAPFSSGAIAPSAGAGPHGPQKGHPAVGPNRNRLAPGGLSRNGSPKPNLGLRPPPAGIGSGQAGLGHLSLPAAHGAVSPNFPQPALSGSAKPGSAREYSKTLPAFRTPLPIQTMSNRNPKPTVIGGSALANAHTPGMLNGTTFKHRP